MHFEKNMFLLKSIHQKRRSAMGRLLHDTGEHLKEVGWALFLINLFILAFFLLFGKYAGYDLMAWIALGTSTLVVAIFGSIFGANLLVILIWHIYTKLRGSRHSEP